MPYEHIHREQDDTCRHTRSNAAHVHTYTPARSKMSAAVTVAHLKHTLNAHRSAQHTDHITGTCARTHTRQDDCYTNTHTETCTFSALLLSVFGNGN